MLTVVGSVFIYIYIYIYMSIHLIAFGKVRSGPLEGGILSARVSAVICRCSTDSGAEREGF